MEIKGRLYESIYTSNPNAQRNTSSRPSNRYHYTRGRPTRRERPTDRKLGFLITTGAPQLLLDQARNVICWQIPFLVQPPIDARGLYPTGEYALVNAYSGTYTLDDEAVHRINLAAIPIIQKLYPDMDAYLRKLKDG